MELTDSQKNIVTQPGKFVVKACPGSGKTFTVAARLAAKLKDWEERNRGIAVISFTNVAWQEIKRYLDEEFNCLQLLRYPHFLGTIDRFVNEYIFLPLGHVIMQCKNRPRLIGPPINNWEPIGSGWYWGNREYNRKGYRLNDFRHVLNGSWNHPYGSIPSASDLAVRVTLLKESVYKVGFATQSDADYISLMTLEKFPELVRAMAYRFPEIIIDEAQDTTEVQMKIIEHLINSEAMLVGDPDQAIFEWNQAKPELFNEKYDAWKENSIELNENWRSSKLICEATHPLSSLSRVSDAKHPEVQDYGFAPQVWSYLSNGDLQPTVSQFVQLCRDQSLNVSPQNVAVLFRSSELMREFIGGSSEPQGLNPWGNHYTFDISRGCYLFQNNVLAQGLKSFERGLLKAKQGDKVLTQNEIDQEVSNYGFSKWRAMLYKAMIQIPKAEGKLGEWIKATNALLTSVDLFGAPVELKLKKRNKYKNLTFGNIFAASEPTLGNTEYRIGTVHSVKGETFDAVLLILKSETRSRKKYANMLNLNNSSSNEELRIVYVAITRPKKILVLAVPESDTDVWKQKLQIN